MTHAAPGLTRYPALGGRTLLVCLGAAKCGTSWLHGYLDGLPDAVVSPLKEVHFFDAKFPRHALGDPERMALSRLRLHLDQPGDMVSNLRDWPDFAASLDRARMVYDDDAYFAHFARLCGPGTRTFCDITPAYAVIGTDGFACLRDFAAAQDVSLKLLFILRDPVDRFWSQLRHMEQFNPAAGALETWRIALDNAALLARADYRGTIEALEAVFSAADIHLAFYETLFSDQGLAQLCGFAGLGFRPPATRERRNVTEVRTPLPDDARHAIRARLDGQYRYCRDRFGPELPAAWEA